MSNTMYNINGQKLCMKLTRRRERCEYTKANNGMIRCQTLCTRLTEGRERHKSARAVFFPWPVVRVEVAWLLRCGPAVPP